jgi:hypothetical protein
MNHFSKILSRLRYFNCNKVYHSRAFYYSSTLHRRFVRLKRTVCHSLASSNYVYTLNNDLHLCILILQTSSNFKLPTANSNCFLRYPLELLHLLGFDEGEAVEKFKYGL